MSTFWSEKKHTHPKLCALSPVTALGRAMTSEKEGGIFPPSFFFPWEKEKDDGKFNKSMTRGKKTRKTKERERKREREKEQQRRRRWWYPGEGRVILTLVSLRMTSIMLPITMRKSKTFQGSLK